MASPPCVSFCEPSNDHSCQNISSKHHNFPKGKNELSRKLLSSKTTVPVRFCAIWPRFSLCYFVLIVRVWGWGSVDFDDLTGCWEASEKGLKLEKVWKNWRFRLFPITHNWLLFANGNIVWVALSHMNPVTIYQKLLFGQDFLNKLGEPTERLIYRFL